MATAEEVLSGNSPRLVGPFINDFWLDLLDLSTYEQAALDYFTQRMKPVEAVDLGFVALGPRGAAALTRLRTDFFSLPDLARLDEPTAAVLGEQSFRERVARYFGVEEPLTAEAALALVGGLSALPDDERDSPLDLSLPSVSVPVAHALRRQGHELYLRVRKEPLSPHAAEVLAHHVGYDLTLHLEHELSVQTKAALCSNPEKRAGWVDAGPGTVAVTSPERWARLYGAYGGKLL